MPHISRTPAAIATILTMLLAGPAAVAARADEVIDWNRTLLRAGLVTSTNVFTTLRNAAIVQGAVFDAVNGIERRYQPLHVEPAAPAGASGRAAAVQAAYATLTQLFPTQLALFNAQRFVSLADLAEREDPAAIASGIAWGQTVADAILAWRSTDGTNAVLPPFLGGTNPGQWRPAPPAFAPGAAPQFATSTPWVIQSPSQFRPGSFPPLTSAQYAADLNEVKLLGRATSTARTVDQTTIAYFWASASSPAYIWDTVATSLMAREEDAARGGEADTARQGQGGRRHALVDHAHLLALVNVAMEDAFIAIWDSKYFYVLWRPITAIQLADTDGNPDTVADPAWLPLIVTPPYPSYVSGLTGVSAAACTALASVLGDRTRFTVRSDVLLGVTRSFRSFTDAVQEIDDARVYAGIHFRFDDDAGRTLGNAVGAYVIENALQRVSDH